MGNNTLNEKLRAYTEASHAAPKHEGVISLAHFTNLGVSLHPFGWGKTTDESEAWDLLKADRTALAQHGDRDAQRLVSAMEVEGAIYASAASFAPKWAHFAFQTVEVDDKYAASLCATKVSRDAVEALRLPWPCFFIKVPAFLRTPTIFVDGVTDVPEWILVNHQSLRGEPDQLFVHVFTGNGSARTMRCESLLALALQEEYDENSWPETAIRAQRMVERLVLGVCISLTDPGTYKRYAPTTLKRKPSMGTPRAGLPNETTFYKVGRPVVLDVRRPLRDYIDGAAGRALTVRTLVTGHWKRQAHGPGSSLRRWQFIECYWKGPEESPRLKREHVLRAPLPV